MSDFLHMSMMFCFTSVSLFSSIVCFCFNDTATTEIYTLSLHDALPIWPEARAVLEIKGKGWSRDHGRSASLRRSRSEEHTSELQSHSDLVCRLLLEKKKKKKKKIRKFDTEH